MTRSAFCFGVKIILNDKDDPVAENWSIGLYNVVGDNSEFRWSQSYMYSSSWCPGMIIEGGLSKFTTEIDLREGGAVELPGSGSVTIKNTGKFWEELESRGILLNGLRLEIWTVIGHGSVTSERLRTYYCQGPTWDSTKFKIPFKGGYARKVANLLLPVNSIAFPYASADTVKNIIPASFGRLFPAYDANGNLTRSAIAEGIKVSDREDYTLYNNAWFTESALYSETTEFPIYWCASSESDDTDFIVEFRGGDLRTISEYLTIDDAVYIYVSTGNGKGQYRRVVSWANDGTPDTRRLQVYVDSFFATPIQDKDGVDPSWIQIIKINKDFYFDQWPCKDYLDSEGAVIENTPELYTIVNENLDRALNYAYSSEGSVENNKAEIVPLLYSDDLDTIDSMIIMPVESIYLNTATDLSAWENSTYTDLSSYVRKEDGVYVKLPENLTITDKSFVGWWYAYDKKYNTYSTFFLKASATTPTGFEYYAKAICFQLPEQPRIEWDTLLIGIRLRSLATMSNSSGTGGSPIKIMMRRWAYNVSINAMDSTLANEEDNDGVLIDTLPDFYYTNTVSFENRGYFGSPPGASPYEDIYGQYEFTGVTPDNYNSYIEGLLLLFRYTAGSGFYDDGTYIYELSLIFKKDGQDISKEILTPFAGRIYNDTWGNRKISNDLIQHPIDILEHVCRLQNWSDRGPIPVSGWGLQYSDDARIATVGYGSFDDPDLIAVREYFAAEQITDYEEGYTDTVKQTICNDFNVANWQDKDGYERVIAVPAVNVTPVYTIQLSDILDRSSIKVYDLSQDKMIAEPWVEYGYNPAKSEYDNKIAIINSSSPAYTFGFAPGIQNETKAKELWGSCHSLYLMCNQINKPNSTKTTLHWANGEFAYSIAIDYLENWINWQFTNEIEFKTHFNIAASWDLCTPINVLLSHQTDNISRRALIENIEMNPNAPYDMLIKAILYA
jgi:hypothetical protein